MPLGYIKHRLEIVESPRVFLDVEILVPQTLILTVERYAEPVLVEDFQVPAERFFRIALERVLTIRRDPAVRDEDDVVGV